MSKEKEYGDFQTPEPLAKEVVSLISKQFGAPGAVIEPTCGLGSFIKAAYDAWGEKTSYTGYEINPSYCESAWKRFAGLDCINIEERDILSKESIQRISPPSEGYTLILGNPPWVTNSALGSLNSGNLPEKNNFQGLRGLDAKTGKSNFDIAEWIIGRLIEKMAFGGILAMLCKTATARRVLDHFWNSENHICDESLYLIDAKKTFDVSVDACLLVVRKRKDANKSAFVYENMQNLEPISRFGIVNGELIANLDDYRRYRDLDGFSNYIWRSGVKHDAAKIMELTPDNCGYINGLGETVYLENDYIYPLLKSSDIANGRITPRKCIIITQSGIGRNTQSIKDSAPKTWAYLEAHAGVLDSRKSSIYKKRPRFSIFGIGDYSFAPWKVAISGLYKKLRFASVPPFNDRQTMLDDTCYFIPCDSEGEAKFWERELNSDDCIRFLHSLVFFDSKRPVNIDILRRIDFSQLTKRHDKSTSAEKYLRLARSHEKRHQTMLVFAGRD